MSLVGPLKPILEARSAAVLADSEKRIAERRRDETAIERQVREWYWPRCLLEPCPNCGERFSNLGGEPCAACEVVMESRRLRGLPKEIVLARTGTPRNLRTHEDWMDDPRAWPTATNTFVTSAWKGQDCDPWVVVLSGKNGTGKSCRAAELLFRAYRHEPRRLIWVREPDLLAESRTFNAKILMDSAKLADVLVVDDMGITRDKRDTEAAWTAAQELINYRYDRSRPMIITTHRLLTKGADSIKSCAPSLFDRIRSGAVCRMPDKSWR